MIQNFDLERKKSKVIEKFKMITSVSPILFNNINLLLLLSLKKKIWDRVPGQW